jgi:hypothetical protein
MLNVISTFTSRVCGETPTVSIVITRFRTINYQRTEVCTRILQPHFSLRYATSIPVKTN